MSRGWMMALGFWFICSGSAGFERYMLQGNADAAVMDAALSLLGVWMMAKGIDRP